LANGQEIVREKMMLEGNIASEFALIKRSIATHFIDGRLKYPRIKA